MVHVCCLALIKVKDLIHKKFTCLCDDMEIYGSITHVEPFLPPSLPGVQNRKRHGNMRLPFSLVNCQLLLRLFRVSGVVGIQRSLLLMHVKQK